MINNLDDIKVFLNDGSFKKDLFIMWKKSFESSGAKSFLNNVLKSKK